MDIVFQSFDKLFARSQWIDVRSQRFFPTNSYACLTPISIAGMSEYTVSVATASCFLVTSRAGFLDLRCFFIEKVEIGAPH